MHNWTVWTITCPSQKTYNKDKKKCFPCGKLCHFSKECRSTTHADGHKLEGVPPGGSAKRKEVQNVEGEEVSEELPIQSLFELNPLYEIDDEENDIFDEGAPEDHVVEWQDCRSRSGGHFKPNEQVIVGFLRC